MCDNRLAGGETFEAAQHPFISQTVIDSLTSCGEGGRGAPPTYPPTPLVPYSLALLCYRLTCPQSPSLFYFKSRVKSKPIKEEIVKP